MKKVCLCEFSLFHSLSKLCHQAMIVVSCLLECMYYGAVSNNYLCCRTRPKKKSTMHSIFNLSTIYPVALHASNYCRLAMDWFIIPIARRLQARYYLTCAALSCIHITFRVNLIYACVATFYSSYTYWINTSSTWWIFVYIHIYFWFDI